MVYIVLEFGRYQNMTAETLYLSDIFAVKYSISLQIDTIFAALIRRPVNFLENLGLF